MHALLPFRPFRILSEVFNTYARNLGVVALLSCPPVIAKALSILASFVASVTVVRVLNGVTLFLAFSTQLCVLIYVTRLKENSHYKAKFAEVYRTVFSSFASFVWILMLTFLSLLGTLAFIFLVVGVMSYLFSSFGTVATLVVNQLDSVLTIVGSVYYVLFGFCAFAFILGDHKGVKALLSVWSVIRMRASRVFGGFLLAFFTLAITLAVAGIVSGLLASISGVTGAIISVLFLQAVSSMLVVPIGALLLMRLYTDFSSGVGHLSISMYDKGRFVIAALASMGVAALLVVVFSWHISPFGWLLISF